MLDLAQGSSIWGEEKQSVKPKENKSDFRLGRTQEEGESKGLLHSRRHKQSIGKCKERGSQKKKPRVSPLEKRRQSRERCARRRK